MLANKQTKTNQDAHCAKKNFCGNSLSWFFGVFDGHGINGHFVSNYIKSVLPQMIEHEHSLKNVHTGNSATKPVNPSFEADSTDSSKQIANISIKNKGINSGNKKEVISLLSEAFRKTTANLNSEKSIDATFSGTTAVTVILTSSNLYCANVGDSRAVLASLKVQNNANKSESYWVATPISRDHKPDDEYESKRIIKHGGRIDAFRDANDQPIGPNRVWLLNDNIPGLAMSRSFGDKLAASVGVVSEPGIQLTRNNSQEIGSGG